MLNKTKSIRVITLISLLSALCIVSRIGMVDFPNIKPVTSIIIIASLIFGWRFGLALVIITVLGSDLILGMGFYTIMQIIAWGSVALVSSLLGKFYKKIPIWVMAIYAGLCAYLFGIAVSLNMLIIMGPIGFYTYWISGLPFDTVHAISDLIFYPILAPILIKLLESQKKRLSFDC